MKHPRTNTAADAAGLILIEGVVGTPRVLVGKASPKSNAANVSFQQVGDDWAIKIGAHVSMRAEGHAFGLFWEDDNGEHYTACTVPMD